MSDFYAVGYQDAARTLAGSGMSKIALARWQKVLSGNSGILSSLVGDTNSKWLHEMQKLGPKGFLNPKLSRPFEESIDLGLTSAAQDTQDIRRLFREGKFPAQWEPNFYKNME